MTKEQRPSVVIVGAGFGGLRAARALAKAPAEVVLVDRNNYTTFVPMLYQVAAAEVEATEIAYPVRKALRRRHGVRFVMAEVQGLDLVSHLVITDGDPIPYDYLVLAMGAVPHFFGVEGAEEWSFPLYSLEQGTALRAHILRCFERAAREPNLERRQQLLSFAIVGGGPTGVEFTGALAELILGSLDKDFPTIDIDEVRIVLLEALGSLLAMLPAKLQDYSAARLHAMGVEVRLNAAVTRITSEAVSLKDGTVIPTETVVWTAGTRADPRVQNWGLPVVRGGRIAVLPSLQVADYPNIYVVGDLAFLEQEGRPIPMVLRAAVEEGQAAGRNIVRQLKAEEPQLFRYRDPGNLVIVGRNKGVGRIGRSAFTGILAWAAWLAAHLRALPGFRNRLFVLVNWALDYLFLERAVRLILPNRKSD